MPRPRGLEGQAVSRLWRLDVQGPGAAGLDPATPSPGHVGDPFSLSPHRVSLRVGLISSCRDPSPAGLGPPQQVTHGSPASKTATLGVLGLPLRALSLP